MHDLVLIGTAVLFYCIGHWSKETTTTLRENLTALRKTVYPPKTGPIDYASPQKLRDLEDGAREVDAAREVAWKKTLQNE